MHPFDGWVMVICNPIAGMGRSVERLAAVGRFLRARGVSYRSAITKGHGHAVALARSAVAAGCSTVVAIGGDGTLFEVVNGVVGPASPDAPSVPTGRAREVMVGLVQAGRGSDFGRSAGIPSDVTSACQRLLNGRTQVIDLGHVTYNSFSGARRARYFANAAGLGFDAEVALRANAAPRVLGGKVPYLSSLFTTLLSYRNRRAEISLTGAGSAGHLKTRINSVVIANGQYFGGGMRIAPEAELRDGQFDVVVLGNFGKVDLIRNVPRVYDGSHVTHPKVSMFRGTRVDVEPGDRLLLQADGEVLGMAPATFSVVPSALTLVV